MESGIGAKEVHLMRAIGADRAGDCLGDGDGDEEGVVVVEAEVGERGCGDVVEARDDGDEGEVEDADPDAGGEVEEGGSEAGAVAEGEGEGEGEKKGPLRPAEAIISSALAI